METTVFVATNRLGGLDVLESSLSRQTYKDFKVFVIDSYYNFRKELWAEMSHRLGIFIEVHPDPAPVKGDVRVLAKAYNLAREYCLFTRTDLLISLQDYIWIPDNGVESFINLHKKYPHRLLTGLTSISSGPIIELREDYYKHYEKYLYTIFGRPFFDKPWEPVSWEDGRIGIYPMIEDYEFGEILPQHWEANWAAIPVNVFKAGVKWDESYDQGIAYENQQFSCDAVSALQNNVLLDARNIALSLPHKKIFPGEEEMIVKYSNRDRHEAKYGPS